MMKTKPPFGVLSLTGSSMKSDVFLPTGDSLRKPVRPGFLDSGANSLPREGKAKMQGWLAVCVFRTLFAKLICPSPLRKCNN
jgi:hypothetical protein